MHPSSHILVKTVGRAGSTLALEYFKLSGYDMHACYNADELNNNYPEYVRAYKSGDDDTAFIHDHTTTFIPEKVERFYGLLIKRKNLLNQVMSTVISFNTQFYHYYENTIDLNDLEKYKNTLHIDIESMKEQIESIIKSDNERVKSFLSFEIPFTVVYYEDFISKPEYFRSLSINRHYRTDTWGLMRTPLRAKDIITNYVELTEWWEDNKSMFKNKELSD